MVLATVVASFFCGLLSADAAPGDVSVVLQGTPKQRESCVTTGEIFNSSLPPVYFCSIFNMGQIEKYSKSDSTGASGVTVADGLTNPRGMAITSTSPMMLFVAMDGGVKKYTVGSDLTLTGGININLDGGDGYNGLCLSPDETKLYVTVPGWASFIPSRGAAGEAALYEVSVSDSTFTAKFKNTDGVHPNGCTVLGQIVYMFGGGANSLTSFGLDGSGLKTDYSAASSIATAINTPKNAPMPVGYMAADGIVAFGGNLYLSAWNMVWNTTSLARSQQGVQVPQAEMIQAPFTSGTVWKCNLGGEGPTNCAEFLSIPTADMQLDVAKPALIAPDLVTGVVRSVELSPALTPMQTCMDVKTEYKKQGCCGNPMKTFVAPGSESGSKRRLSGEDELQEKVKMALRHAAMQGGTSQARNFANSLRDLVHPYIKDIE